jgi:hypothetical protein
VKQKTTAAAARSRTQAPDGRQPARTSGEAAVKGKATTNDGVRKMRGQAPPSAVAGQPGGVQQKNTAVEARNHGQAPESPALRGVSSGQQPARASGEAAVKGKGTTNDGVTRATPDESPARASTEAPSPSRRQMQPAPKAGAVRRLRIGPGAKTAIEIAVGLMVDWLESELGRVNEDGIRISYKAFVYDPFLKAKVDAMVELARSPALEEALPRAQNTWLYYRYEYDVLFERQASGLSDAIVSAMKGLAQPLPFLHGPQFAEVFVEVKPVGEPRWVPATNAWRRPIDPDKRRKEGGDLFRYRFVHNFLLWDPEVALLSRALRDERSKLLALSPSPDVASLIEGFEFRAASRQLQEVPQRRSDPRMRDLSLALVEADARLKSVADRLASDRRDLLGLYLEADPFGSRGRAIRAEEEERRRRRQADRRVRVIESAASSDVALPGGHIDRRMK